MKFKPYYITSDKLDLLPIVAGQFIVVTDTQTVYFDETNSDRVDISSGTNILTNNLYWNDNSTIENFTPYSKKEIDDKLGTIVSAMELL